MLKNDFTKNRERSDGEYDYYEKYFRQIKRCSTIKIKDETITLRCKKLLCSKCGGEDSRIHKGRYQAVIKRLNGAKNKFVRHFVFSIPEESRKYFISKDRLNQFVTLIEKIIKKEFGILSPSKKAGKNSEQTYRLEKKVVAIFRLFGKDEYFNPKVNVLIFEDSRSKRELNLNDTKLEGIRKSYKKALQTLLKIKINNPVVQYKFYCTSKKITKSIWQVTMPINHKMPEPEFDFDLISYLDFVVFELKGFNFIRFWGHLSNSEYKKYLNNNKE